MEKSEKLHVVKSRGERIIYAVFAVLFALYAATLLYPILWMFLSSLKGSLEYEAGNPFDFPKKWLFSNYIECFRTLKVQETTYLGMVWNSLWMTGISIVLGVFTSGCVCYVVAKLDFPGKRLVYAIVVLQMMIPTYGSMASNLQISKTLGTYDSVAQIVVSAFAVGGTKFLILYAFFKGISWEYAEAAFMDGATHWQVFIKIMFPQAIAPIMTFAMGDFIAGWNDYMMPLIWMPSFPTLAMGLYQYEATMIRSINYPVYYCGVLLSALPAFVIFICFRDTFMSSLSMGGLKG